MIPAFIALGSNLNNPAQQLRDAVATLATLPQSRIGAVSPVYRSIAVGPGDQPDYLNAAMLLHTSLHPVALLDALQAIETGQGRERNVRWGARTLDLDILLYGDQQISTPRLNIPHAAMRERNFVLYPLADIAGDKLLLPDGVVLGTLVSACPGDGLERTPLRLDQHSNGRA